MAQNKINKCVLLFEKDGYSQGIDINNNIISFNESIHQLLHHACLSNGHTKKGAIDAIRFHLNIKQKCPVMINGKDKCIFFPITLGQENIVLWMKYFPSMRIKRMNEYQTLCHFLNHSIIVDVNYRSIKRQVKRCVQYIDILSANELEWDCHQSMSLTVKEILEERS